MALQEAPSQESGIEIKHERVQVFMKDKEVKQTVQQAEAMHKKAHAAISAYLKSPEFTALLDQPGVKEALAKGDHDFVIKIAKGTCRGQNAYNYKAMAWELDVTSRFFINTLKALADRPPVVQAAPATVKPGTIKALKLEDAPELPGEAPMPTTPQNVYLERTPSGAPVKDFQQLDVVDHKGKKFQMFIPISIFNELVRCVANSGCIDNALTHVKR